MICKPFFGPAKSVLRFPVLENIHKTIPVQVPVPERAVFHAGNGGASGTPAVRLGDNVKTGGRVEVWKESGRAVVSTVTGVVSEISEHTGYGGDRYTKIVVKTEKEDEFDEEFQELIRSPMSRDLLPFLDALPGGVDFSFIFGLRSPVRTFVVSGTDREPLVTTNQFMLAARSDGLKEGIRRLRKLFRGCRVIVAVPPYLAAMARTTGAEVAVLEPAYPHTLPAMIMKAAVGVEVHPDRRIEETGSAFVSAETVVALGEAFETGRPVLHKHLTVIGKDGSSTLVRARMGSAVGDVFSTLGIQTDEGDLLVQGGPMAGRSIHSEDMPIWNLTDSLFVQDKADVAFSSNAHCINCGECVRVCPARIPVNMLVRVLENGLWEDATALYDLDACIECGLCSYVCPARIPVFHYIMLGKHEVERTSRAEEADVQG